MLWFWRWLKVRHRIHEHSHNLFCVAPQPWGQNRTPCCNGKASLPPFFQKKKCIAWMGTKCVIFSSRQWLWAPSQQLNLTVFSRIILIGGDPLAELNILFQLFITINAYDFMFRFTHWSSLDFNVSQSPVCLLTAIPRYSSRLTMSHTF